MSSEDKQVIDMVNAPWERQKQLQALPHQRRVRERVRRAGAINAMLRIALVLELMIIALAVGFIIVAG